MRLLQVNSSAGTSAKSIREVSWCPPQKQGKNKQKGFAASVLVPSNLRPSRNGRHHCNIHENGHVGGATQTVGLGLIMRALPFEEFNYCMTCLVYKMKNILKHDSIGN